MNTFETSLQDGEFREHVVWNFLQKSKKTRQVIDVRSDKKFQGKDVDFLVEDINRQIHWVEVKTDYQAHKTGNIVYEVSTSGNIGCFAKTECEEIFYYLPESQTLYFIPINNLRWFIEEWAPKLVAMGDNAQGYLLSIERLKAEKVITRTYEGVK